MMSDYQFVPVEFNTLSEEEAYLQQREKVEKLLVNPAYPIYLSLDELFRPSQHSREGVKYKKNKRGQPPRPPNSFIIFKNNFVKNFSKTSPDGMSAKDLANAEWERQKQNPAVEYLFTELADLANKYHQYKNPQYKYKPNRDRNSLYAKPQHKCKPNGNKNLLNANSVHVLQSLSPKENSPAYYIPTPSNTIVNFPLTPPLTISANISSEDIPSHVIDEHDFILYDDNTPEMLAGPLFPEVMESSVIKPIQDYVEGNVNYENSPNFTNTSVEGRFSENISYVNPLTAELTQGCVEGENINYENFPIFTAPTVYDNEENNNYQLYQLLSPEIVINLDSTTNKFEVLPFTECNVFGGSMCPSENDVEHLIVDKDVIFY